MNSLFSVKLGCYYLMPYSIITSSSGDLDIQVEEFMSTEVYTVRNNDNNHGTSNHGSSNHGNGHHGITLETRNNGNYSGNNSVSRSRSNTNELGEEGITRFVFSQIPLQYCRSCLEFLSLITSLLKLFIIFYQAHEQWLSNLQFTVSISGLGGQLSGVCGPWASLRPPRRPPLRPPRRPPLRPPLRPPNVQYRSGTSQRVVCTG